MGIVVDFIVRSVTMQDYIDINGSEREPCKRTNEDDKVRTTGRSLTYVRQMMILNGRKWQG